MVLPAYCHSPGLEAVVTNNWCIRVHICRAQPNNKIFDRISDEKPPQMNILNIIICCTCNICSRAIEQTTEIDYTRVILLYTLSRNMIDQTDL